MKINKDTQRMARRLFRLCLTSGSLDEAKLRLLIRSLAEKKPRNLVPVLNALKQYVEVEMNKHKAVVTSSAPLADSETALIRQRLVAHHGRELSIDWQVDPALIAGLHIQIGDEVIDGSLKTRLHNLLNTHSL